MATGIAEAGSDCPTSSALHSAHPTSLEIIFEEDGRLLHSISLQYA